jgi:hypothetical protein
VSRQAYSIAICMALRLLARWIWRATNQGNMALDQYSHFN